MAHFTHTQVLWADTSLCTCYICSSYLLFLVGFCFIHNSLRKHIFLCSHLLPYILLFVAHVLYLLQNASLRISEMLETIEAIRESVSLVKGCSWSAHLIWNVDYLSVYYNCYISGHLPPSHAATDVAVYGWVMRNNLHRVKSLLITFKVQACQTQQLAVCSVSMERECCKGKESHSCAVTSSTRMPVTFQTLINLLNIFLNVWSFDMMCKSGGSSFIFVHKLIYFYFLTFWQCMDKLLLWFLNRSENSSFLCIRYCA